jgi:hypothetical protein
MDIFARLNTYTTPLNKQELINAEFYGYFKQSVYSMSYKYNKFWIDNKVFTEYQTMRMNEVELTADIFIAFLDGIQNRKKSKYIISNMMIVSKTKMNSRIGLMK